MPEQTVPFRMSIELAFNPGMPFGTARIVRNIEGLPESMTLAPWCFDEVDEAFFTLTWETDDRGELEIRVENGTARYAVERGPEGNWHFKLVDWTPA